MGYPCFSIRLERSIMKLHASAPLTSADAHQLGLTIVVAPRKFVPVSVRPITREEVSAVISGVRRATSCSVSPWERCVQVFLSHVREGSQQYQRLYRRLERLYDAVMRRQAVSC